MGIVQDDIDRVREATDLVQLVTQYLQLKRVGRSWTGLCPFHSEKTPSFNVNGEAGFYKCFGCGRGGDAIEFLREIEHLDFPAAVERLAGRAGIQLSYTTKDEGAGQRKRKVLLDAVARAVEWYHERLVSGPDAGAARAYLRDRGLDGDTVRHWQIGWAPDDWDQLASALKLPSDVLSESGLGFVNRRGRQQDAFRNRVLFPIHDVNGVAVGFGGRILPGGEGPKYKNSQDSAIYHKSRVLYGLHLAKDDAVRSDEVIVCEGYTDVIGFATAGLPRAVATCGTALTDDHVKLLRRFSKRVVLAFDADAAGQAAAERFYEWEQRFEIDVAVADLPDGVDPADLARTDPERLEAAVTDAKPFLGFRVDRVLDAANLATPEGRARGAERAAALVLEHPNPLVRDQYLMQIADYCRVDVDRLRAGTVRRDPRAPGKAVGVDAGAPGTTPRRFADDPEVRVLRLAVHLPDTVPDYVDERLFADPLHRAVLAALLGSQTHHEAVEAAGGEAAELLQQLLVEEPPDDTPSAVVARLLHDAAQRRLRALETDPATADDPEAARQLAPLKLAIDAVRHSYWKLDVAERLLDWLGARAEEMA